MRQFSGKALAKAFLTLWRKRARQCGSICPHFSVFPIVTASCNKCRYLLKGFIWFMVTNRQLSRYLGSKLLFCKVNFSIAWQLNEQLKYVGVYFWIELCIYCDSVVQLIMLCNPNQKVRKTFENSAYTISFLSSALLNNSQLVAA